MSGAYWLTMASNGRSVLTPMPGSVQTRNAPPPKKAPPKAHPKRISTAELRERLGRARDRRVINELSDWLHERECIERRAAAERVRNADWIR